MLTEEKKARIAEKWAYYRECSSKKRKKLRDHSFAFYVEYEYDWGVEDAFRFEVDEETHVIGLGYAGPRSDDFVRIVTNLKEKDTQEVGYLYEPGEANLLFQDDLQLRIFAQCVQGSLHRSLRRQVPAHRVHINLQSAFPPFLAENRFRSEILRLRPAAFAQDDTESCFLSRCSPVL